MGWEGHVARTGQNGDKKESSHWSERATRKDYTKLDLTETAMEDVNGIHLAKDSRQ